MSGTSMDGVDLSFIESDGKKVIKNILDDYVPYDDAFKEKLRHIIQTSASHEDISQIENELTILHGDFVNNFLKKNNIKAQDIDLISFHGHTILHDVEAKKTWQIGDCQLLANMCHINVVGDFRKVDVANNGQGAPLVPIYHFNLLQENNDPIATLNIGGISNITYFDNDNEHDIIAFDVCFGNAPLDDLVKAHSDHNYDIDGKLARSGTIDLSIANAILDNQIFAQRPPKSFDRDEFKNSLKLINKLTLNDALATLSYIHAKALDLNLAFLPQRPKKLYLCGGGRKNKFLVEQLKLHLHNIDIINIDDIGHNGDTIESSAFAYLGIRSLLKLPISFPKTTGIDKNKLSSGKQYNHL